MKRKDDKKIAIYSTPSANFVKLTRLYFFHLFFSFVLSNSFSSALFFFSSTFSSPIVCPFHRPIRERYPRPPLRLLGFLFLDIRELHVVVNDYAKTSMWNFDDEQKKQSGRLPAMLNHLASYFHTQHRACTYIYMRTRTALRRIAPPATPQIPGIRRIYIHAHIYWLTHTGWAPAHPLHTYEMALCEESERRCAKQRQQPRKP